MEKLNQKTENGGKFKDKLQSFFARFGQDTPPFFKKLRIAGLAIAAAGTVLVAAPVALPAIVTAIGGYLIVGGTVISTVSQTAIDEQEELSMDAPRSDSDLEAQGAFAH